MKEKTTNNEGKTLLTEVGRAKRRETKGRLVAILGILSDNRHLVLIPEQSRVFCKNEIHELQTTDEVVQGNKVIDRVGVIGFFEVTQGGSVGVGDLVFINGREVGKVAGFNDIHFPNHYSIVISSPRGIVGVEAGFHIGDEFRTGGFLEE